VLVTRNRRRRVVVLEEDPNMRSLLCGAAQAHGMLGVPAGSYAAARAKLRWFQANAVLMDFELGEWAAHRRLLRELVVAGVPAVLRASQVEMALRRVGLTAPVVHKRAPHRELFTAIADAIDTRRLGRGGQEDWSWQ